MTLFVVKCGWQNSEPVEDAHILMPRTCDYVNLHDRRDFADMTKLRTLGQGDQPALYGWAQSNDLGLKSGKLTSCGQKKM